MDHSIIESGDNHRQLLEAENAKYNRMVLNPLDTHTDLEGISESILLSESLTDIMVKTKEHRQDLRKG